MWSLNENSIGVHTIVTISLLMHGRTQIKYHVITKWWEHWFPYYYNNKVAEAENHRKYHVITNWWQNWFQHSNLNVWNARNLSKVLNMTSQRVCHNLLVLFLLCKHLIKTLAFYILWRWQGKQNTKFVLNTEKIQYQAPN